MFKDGDLVRVTCNGKIARIVSGYGRYHVRVQWLHKRIQTLVHRDNIEQLSPIELLVLEVEDD